MAQTLDSFFKQRQSNGPLMTDESLLPQGTVTFNPDDASKGIPVSGQKNAKGQVVAKIPGMGIEGVKPVAKPMDDKVAEVAKVTPKIIPEEAQKIMQQMMMPQEQQEVGPQAQRSIDLKGIRETVDKEGPNASLADFLVGLIPVVGDAMAGGQGFALDSSSKYYLDKDKSITDRKNKLEDKLLEIERSRMSAKAKADAKTKAAEKLPTTSNVLPIQTEDGVKYEWVDKAVGQLRPETKTTGLTLDDRLKLESEKARLKGIQNKTKREQEDLKRIQDMEKYYGTERSKDPFTRDTRKVAGAYNNLVKIDPNSKDPMRDIGVVFEFMKTLDPGSVVRESEQSLVMGARSVGDFVANVEDMVTRNQKLTPDQIRNIQKFASLQYKRRLDTQKQTVDDRYLGIAKKYKLDPSVIVDSLSVGTPLIWKNKIISVPDDKVQDAIKAGAIEVK